VIYVLNFTSRQRQLFTTTFSGQRIDYANKKAQRLLIEIGSSNELSTKKKPRKQKTATSQHHPA